MVTKFSWSDEMSDRKENTKNDTNATNNNVGDTQEGILASHNGFGGDNHGFGAAIFCYWEVCEMISMLSGAFVSRRTQFYILWKMLILYVPAAISSLSFLM